MTQVNTQFERSFATLAYAFVQDKASKLMPYMIGFQVIHKNDEDTRAAGTFGFKVGDQWMYSPMFFINGDLKGHELLYVRTPDLFIPCQENWINFILSHDSKVMGAGESRSMRDLGVLPPDFRAYYRSPLSGGKSAEFSFDWAPGTGDWLVGHTVKHAGFHSEDFDVSPLVAAVFRDPKDDELSLALDFRTLVKDAMLARGAARLLQWRPSLQPALERFYDGTELVPDQLVKAAEPVTSADLDTLGMPRAVFNYYVRDLAANGLSALRSEEGRRVQQFLVSRGIDTPGAVRVNLPVLTLTPDEVRHSVTPVETEPEVELLEVATPHDDLSEKEAEALMLDGYVIRDLRKSASEAYRVEALSEYARCPDETGYYSVMGADGDWHDVFVAVNPRVPGRIGRLGGCSLVTDGRRCVLATSNTVWTRGSVDADRVKLETQDMLDVDPKTRKAVIMLAPGGRDATAGLAVRGKTETALLVGTYPVMPPKLQLPEYQDYYRYLGNEELSNPDTGFGVRAFIRGDRVQPAYGALVLPESWKAVLVSDYPEFRLGNLEQVKVYLLRHHGLRPVSITRAGSGFTTRVDGDSERHLTEKDAVWHLVRDHGLRVPEAQAAVEQAGVNGYSRILVKHAAGYYAPSMHELDNPARYDETLGYPVMERQQARIPVDGLEDSYATPDTYAYEPQDQRTMAAAEQAAQRGEKEVMDVGVLASMVRAVDIDRFSEKYLKDLTRGLDRVGRLLFLYYWHYDKFADRYGKDEMEELESALQNTFKAVGDTVLFLKKKTVDADRMFQGSDASLSLVAGTGVGS